MRAELPRQNLTTEDAEDTEETRKKNDGDRSKMTVRGLSGQFSTLLEHPQLELLTPVCFFAPALLRVLRVRESFEFPIEIACVAFDLDGTARRYGCRTCTESATGARRPRAPPGGRSAVRAYVGDGVDRLSDAVDRAMQTANRDTALFDRARKRIPPSLRQACCRVHHGPSLGGGGLQEMRRRGLRSPALPTSRRGHRPCCAISGSRVSGSGIEAGTACAQKA